MNLQGAGLLYRQLEGRANPAPTKITPTAQPTAQQPVPYYLDPNRFNTIMWTQDQIRNAESGWGAAKRELEYEGIDKNAQWNNITKEWTTEALTPQRERELRQWAESTYDQQQIKDSAASSWSGAKRMWKEQGLDNIPRQYQDAYRWNKYTKTWELPPGVKYNIPKSGPPTPTDNSRNDDNIDQADRSSDGRGNELLTPTDDQIKEVPEIELDPQDIPGSIKDINQADSIREDNLEFTGGLIGDMPDDLVEANQARTIEDSVLAAKKRQANWEFAKYRQSNWSPKLQNKNQYQNYSGYVGPKSNVDRGYGIKRGVADDYLRIYGGKFQGRVMR